MLCYTERGVQIAVGIKVSDIKIDYTELSGLAQYNHYHPEKWKKKVKELEGNVTTEVQLEMKHYWL